MPQIELTSRAEGIHWRLINTRKPTHSITSFVGKNWTYIQGNNTKDPSYNFKLPVTDLCKSMHDKRQSERHSAVRSQPTYISLRSHLWINYTLYSESDTSAEIASRQSRYIHGRNDIVAQLSAPQLSAVSQTISCSLALLTYRIRLLSIVLLNIKNLVTFWTLVSRYREDFKVSTYFLESRVLVSFNFIVHQVILSMKWKLCFIWVFFRRSSVFNNVQITSIWW